MEFFTGTIKIPMKTYKAHEAVFFTLIHHAVKDVTKFGIKASCKDTAFLHLLKQVFGNNPTMVNQ